jgi:hypothetical protein
VGFMKKLIIKSNNKDVVKKVTATVLSALCLGIGVLTIKASENNYEQCDCLSIEKVKEEKESLYNLYKLGDIDANEFRQKISKLSSKDVLVEEDFKDDSKEVESSENKECKLKFKKALTFGAAALVILGLSCGSIEFKDYTNREDRSM